MEGSTECASEGLDTTLHYTKTLSFTKITRVSYRAPRYLDVKRLSKILISDAVKKSKVTRELGTFKVVPL